MKTIVKILLFILCFIAVLAFGGAQLGEVEIVLVLALLAAGFIAVPRLFRH